MSWNPDNTRVIVSFIHFVAVFLLLLVPIGRNTHGKTDEELIAAEQQQQ